MVQYTSRLASGVMIISIRFGISEIIFSHIFLPLSKRREKGKKLLVQKEINLI